MPDPTFSLVIPCFNEARNLPLLVDRCAAIAARSGVEVVFVDNGSTDDSPAIFAELLPMAPGCRVVRVDVNQGYGFGILAGLRASDSDVLGWTHADLQTDPRDALTALSLLGTENALVKGRRYGRPLGDVMFTIGMSFFESLLLTTRLWDINAQPTVFRREFFESWIDPPPDFSLDLYAYYRARRAGLRVHRFPVRFGERAHGVSNWNVDWRSKRKFIRRTVQYSSGLRKRVG